MIREITLKNFKSFTDIHFNFLGKNKTPHKLVMIYGANGSGKTNFVELFQFLEFNCHSLSIQALLSDYLREQADEIDAFKLKNLFHQNSMQSIIQKNKTIGSKSNMVIEFSFLWCGKIGSYYMEFDDKQIVKERLEYTLAKNRSMFYEITSASAKYNSSVFSGSFLSDVKDLKKKYWGKHSLISILGHLMQTYSAEYARSQFNDALAEVLEMFCGMSYRLVGHKSTDRDLGGIDCLLEDYDHGTISVTELDNLKRTEKLINEFFTNLYSDIQMAFYEVKPLSGKRLQYALFFRKKLSGKLIDVKYDLESCGTLGLLELLPHFVAANHDTVAVIDEIDNGIHDYLLKELIESIAPCIHGQLIFTTHNMLFLENYDFKDNIYVIDTDTDGNKTVKALCDNSFRIQKSSNVLLNYFEGKFGGMPKINPEFDFEKVCKYSYPQE